MVLAAIMKTNFPSLDTQTKLSVRKEEPEPFYQLISNQR